MDERSEPRYLKICMGYRLLSITLSTALYLFLIPGPGGEKKLWIAAGMLAACFLGGWLYLRMDGQKNWVALTAAVEIFFYGIFTFLSGGFYSPYLWYFISCLLIVMSLRSSQLLTLLAFFWCLLCAAAGAGGEFEGLTINLSIGLAAAAGAFYILFYYIQKLAQQKQDLKELNRQLAAEKERSEHALVQITNLYETTNLLAMTDPVQVMEALVELLNRTITPGGCVLAKIDVEGKIQRQASIGIEKTRAENLLEHGVQKMKKNGDGSCFWKEEGESYEAVVLGDRPLIQGLLIRKKSAATDLREDSFYTGIIRIIFQNLDMYGQIGNYIAVEEQNRIANEIHDTVIQKLFGLVCAMKILEMQLDSLDREEVRARVDQLKNSTELTMSELRESIYGHCFQEDSERSFAGTLKTYMNEMGQLSGTQVSVEIDPQTAFMTAPQKIAVYRVACEAVNNAIRHGKADHVHVEIKLDEKQIQAAVTDDGTGFEQVQAAPLSGNGLRNMYQMASMLKGSLQVTSDGGQGTAVHLCLPR